MHAEERQDGVVGRQVGPDFDFGVEVGILGQRDDFDSSKLTWANAVARALRRAVETLAGAHVSERAGTQKVANLPAVDLDPLAVLVCAGAEGHDAVHEGGGRILGVAFAEA